MSEVPPPPLYLEEKIPELLGVSRDDLKYVRREILKKERDWTSVARNVVLTQEGLNRMLDYLRQSRHAQVAGVDFAGCLLVLPPQKKNGTGGDLVALTVRRTLPNYRLLIASDGGAGDVRVRVKTNVNFRPRMQLRGRLVAPGLYQMEGRCPRFPGRY